MKALRWFRPSHRTREGLKLLSVTRGFAVAVALTTAICSPAYAAPHLRPDIAGHHASPHASLHASPATSAPSSEVVNTGWQQGSNENNNGGRERQNSDPPPPSQQNNPPPSSQNPPPSSPPKDDKNKGDKPDEGKDKGKNNEDVEIITQEREERTYLVNNNMAVTDDAINDLVQSGLLTAAQAVLQASCNALAVVDNALRGVADMSPLQTDASQGCAGDTQNVHGFMSRFSSARLLEQMYQNSIEGVMNALALVLLTVSLMIILTNAMSAMVVGYGRGTLPSDIAQNLLIFFVVGLLALNSVSLLTWIERDVIGNVLSGLNTTTPSGQVLNLVADLYAKINAQPVGASVEFVHVFIVAALMFVVVLIYAVATLVFIARNVLLALMFAIAPIAISATITPFLRDLGNGWVGKVTQLIMLSVFNQLALTLVGGMWGGIGGEADLVNIGAGLLMSAIIAYVIWTLNKSVLSDFLGAISSVWNGSSTVVMQARNFMVAVGQAAKQMRDIMRQMHNIMRALLGNKNALPQQYQPMQNGNADAQPPGSSPTFPGLLPQNSNSSPPSSQSGQLASQPSQGVQASPQSLTSPNSPSSPSRLAPSSPQSPTPLRNSGNANTAIAPTGQPTSQLGVHTQGDILAAQSTPSSPQGIRARRPGWATEDFSIPGAGNERIMVSPTAKQKIETTYHSLSRDQADYKGASVSHMYHGLHRIALKVQDHIDYDALKITPDQQGQFLLDMAAVMGVNNLRVPRFGHLRPPENPAAQDIKQNSALHSVVTYLKDNTHAIYQPVDPNQTLSHETLNYMRAFSILTHMMGCSSENMYQRLSDDTLKRVQQIVVQGDARRIRDVQYDIEILKQTLNTPERVQKFNHSIQQIIQHVEQHGAVASSDVQTLIQEIYYPQANTSPSSNTSASSPSAPPAVVPSTD